MNLFPYDTVRDIQKDLIADVEFAVKHKRHLIAHAPTGLGKTVSSIAPALEYALENKMKIFFLTSRHTQHKIVLDTLRDIKKKYNQSIQVTDIVGKQNMCLQEGVSNLYSSEFFEYCKKSREEGKCEFYVNTKEKNRLTVLGQHTVTQLKDTIFDVEEVKRFCQEDKLCPYEISKASIKHAHVIIADYFAIFNDTVRRSLLESNSVELDQCIVIVDEGHNLPDRIRELLSTKISTRAIERAIKEVKEVDKLNLIQPLSILSQTLFSLEPKEEEAQLRREALLDPLLTLELDQLLEECDDACELIHEKKQRSSLSAITGFLRQWQGPDIGFSRIIEKKQSAKGKEIHISYRCLDPSLISKDIIEKMHSTILMSGTLTPAPMYKDLLGFTNALVREYPSPFPVTNRLSLVVPKTTTKYQQRSETQFKDIAMHASAIANATPGNVAIFFPSYNIMQLVYRYFRDMCDKTVFLEDATMSKIEKDELIERFKKYKQIGAVLLGVAAGSYSEGIDLPGDLLNGVIVVGLPLSRPNLNQKNLIDYYDFKFNKGWDYGYTYPALNKVMQASGRCIRSETDKGVIVFLDERYAWSNYMNCFPKEWKVKVTEQYLEEINEFFHTV